MPPGGVCGGSDVVVVEPGTVVMVTSGTVVVLAVVVSGTVDVVCIVVLFSGVVVVVHVGFSGWRSHFHAPALAEVSVRAPSTAAVARTRAARWRFMEATLPVRAGHQVPGFPPVDAQLRVWPVPNVWARPRNMNRVGLEPRTFLA